MPTYVHFVRHAQGFHNLSNINHQIPDPDLTPLGKEQCAQLCKAFPFHEKITHLVASPMRRTLYTCLLSFEPEAKAGKTVIALPDLQEVSDLPCDVGSTVKRLAAEFEPEQVDFSLMTPNWNDKTSVSSPYVPDMAKLEARAKNARLWLRELGAENPEGDTHIAAVTHGGFLHFLTQDFDGMNPQYGTGWANCEYRSYEFVDPTGADPDASLRETKTSWRRRRGSATGLTETEQMELRIAVKSKIEEIFGDAPPKKDA
ncbi:histidine phosphatase superfamily [Cercophora scortea]|uniref:Histidine phosphatase superfamily n=1 Tax=Cercophora scortea TaxID=314031 RepID=A0AAE0MHL0_9PEZI|nr:histidine phosphatase superfamily [Cercophora scortea]